MTQAIVTCGSCKRGSTIPVDKLDIETLLEGGRYSFECPHCRQVVSNTCTDPTMKQLLEAGAPLAFDVLC